MNAILGRVRLDGSTFGMFRESCDDQLADETWTVDQIR